MNEANPVHLGCERQGVEGARTTCGRFFDVRLAGRFEVALADASAFVDELESVVR